MADNNITLDEYEVEALRRVIDYVYEDEITDFISTGQPESHIFRAISALRGVIERQESEAALLSLPDRQ